MSIWIRFEDGRSRAILDHATITKDGRLVIGNRSAIEFGLTPGKFVELYHAPDCARIGIRVMDNPTPYSIKITSTSSGGAATFGQIPAGRHSLPSAIINVRGYLNSRRIGLASKVKGQLFIDEEAGLVVFEFASPPDIISPTEHVRMQMVKQTTSDKVAGDKS